MRKRGVATLPLHHGKAPAWLFERMVRLAGEISCVMVTELGEEVFLEKLSDPYWFQALGCVLGFDWHSSGLTTTTLGALKEALRGREKELGIFIAGGKGFTSRKTPDEIRKYAERFGFNPEPLIYASRLSAKVDNTAIQDGYELYHHVFVFTRRLRWAVIQQGMNKFNKTARRYHWLSDCVKEFTSEPHRAICCDVRGDTLNMVARESEDARIISVQLSREKPEKVINELKRIQELNLSPRHNVTLDDINPGKLYTILTRTYEEMPHDFEKLLGINGVGPKTIRALALISELIYGKPPSYSDPARYSFAHGGKDGTPYPVDRVTYDRTIEILKKAIQRTRIEVRERESALRRLLRYIEKKERLNR